MYMTTYIGQLSDYVKLFYGLLTFSVLFYLFISVEIDRSKGNSGVLKEAGSKKWVRSESCSGSSSKACREKMRMDKLNDKFMELDVILDPGRPPKTDKAAILVDAVRMVTQLRAESQKLKDTNLDIQDKIKELKVPSGASLGWVMVTIAFSFTNSFPG